MFKNVNLRLCVAPKVFRRQMSETRFARFFLAHLVKSKFSNGKSTPKEVDFFDFACFCNRQVAVGQAVDTGFATDVLRLFVWYLQATLQARRVFVKTLNNARKNASGSGVFPLAFFLRVYSNLCFATGKLQWDKR